MMKQSVFFTLKKCNPKKEVPYYRYCSNLIAIKRISLKDELVGVPGSTLREISILKVLGEHENCVR